MTSEAQQAMNDSAKDTERKTLNHFVVAQVDPFVKSKTLKSVSHVVIGSTVETSRFQAMGKLHSTCTAPPLEQARLRGVVVVAQKPKHRDLDEQAGVRRQAFDRRRRGDPRDLFAVV
jgi:hypothetical protein